MQIAHLILAHNGPKQLERLVDRLAHPEAVVYIHLDKKTPIGPFEHLKDYPNVFFIKNRVNIYWGSYNMVEATLVAFKEIIGSGIDFKFVNLLSGQDYPLKPQKTFHDFLSQNQGTAFMNYLVFETDWHEAISRINQYHLNNFRIKGKYFFQKLLNKILPERTFPQSLTPVGRSQWFTIPLECANYIVEYWHSNRKLRRFIKLTWAPDEFIFQTILYNSRYKEKMVNNNLRYMKWSPGDVSPNTLTSNNASEILNSGKFFSRKFDMIVDPKVLDIIDEQALLVKI
jgi:Core-2/I-Branching enzyme